MKRILLIATLVLSIFGMSYAQTTNNTQAQQRPAVRAKIMVGKINAAVRLEGDEWTKVNNALVDYYTAYDNLDSKSADFNAKVDALKKTRDNGIKAGLTGDKYAKWVAYAQQQKIEQ